MIKMSINCANMQLQYHSGFYFVWNSTLFCFVSFHRSLLLVLLMTVIVPLFDILLTFIDFFFLLRVFVTDASTSSHGICNIFCLFLAIRDDSITQSWVVHCCTLNVRYHFMKRKEKKNQHQKHCYAIKLWAAHTEYTCYGGVSTMLNSCFLVQD